MVAQRNIVGFALSIILLPLLAACNSTHNSRWSPESYIARYQDFPPTTERFQVCNDIQCEDRIALSLDNDEWQQLAGLFDEPAESAATEREQIRSAIGLFEVIVAPVAQTHTDVARNEVGKLGERQLDCIAETVNTTTYILLFQEQGWLQWHEVSVPQHRGFFTGHWPHNAAVIREKQSGKEFVVDSYFYKNGEPPVIVSAERWQAGYDPDE